MSEKALIIGDTKIHLGEEWREGGAFAAIWRVVGWSQANQLIQIERFGVKYSVPMGTFPARFTRNNAAVSEAHDHPAHYGGADNPYEVIKVIEAWELGFRLGNAVKCIARAGKQDPTEHVEDLKKARWYLNREIEKVEKENG